MNPAALKTKIPPFLRRTIKSFLSRSPTYVKQYKNLIPPYELNWNFGGTKSEYRRTYFKPEFELYFPFLIQQAREQNIATDELSLLDIGCGWGPMAAAFVNYKRSLPSGQEVKYLGIDIREDVIDWLSKQYKEYDFVKFFCHNADPSVDYIKAHHENYKSAEQSSGNEAIFDISPTFSYNIQWTSSVFTHLSPQACVEMLKTIQKSASQKSVQVNTWIIVDDESRYALLAGLTDRTLPYDHGSYLTSSEQNPLVCTAFKLEAIQDFYSKSGLRIIKIDRGSWRGDAYRNAARHYQDIIVSVPV